MILGETDAESIELSVQILGITEDRARELLAFAKGEVVSDLVVLGEDGEPLPLEEQRAILGLEEE